MPNFYHALLSHAFIDNEVTQLSYISIKSKLIYFHTTVHDCQHENYTPPSAL